MRLLALFCCLLTFAACDMLKTTGMNATESRLYEEAKAKEKSGDLPKAGELYREAVKASTGSVNAHLALAALLREQGKGSEAVPLMQQAAALQPENPEVLKELGNAYIATGEGQKALDAFDQSIKIKDTDARAFSGRGVALDMLKRHDEAQKSYRAAMDLVPANKAYIENNLALSLIATKNYQEAIALLETLSATPDATAQTRQNLAMAYALSGDEAKAREWSRKDLSEAATEANLSFYKRLREQRTQEPISKTKPTTQKSHATQKKKNR